MLPGLFAFLIFTLHEAIKNKVGNKIETGNHQRE